MVKLELTKEDFEIVYKSVLHNLKRLKDTTKMQHPEQVEAYKQKVKLLVNKLAINRKQERNKLSKEI